MSAITDLKSAGDGLLRRRGLVLLAFAALMAALLVAGLAMRALGEAGEANTYALLAEAFLNGRLDVSGCFDEDCAIYADRMWVIFPPAPAVLVMPFVALFGPGFSGFILLAMLLTGISLALWWRILGHLGLDRETAVWLVLALAFATPLYYVTIRGDGVWFFAQTVAFLGIAVAIHETVRGGSLVLAGVAIGVAFLSRQMSIFMLPFLFALALRSEEPLISFRWPHWRRALALGLPVAAAVLIYFAYNYVRFGSPTDTGYGYMMPPSAGAETMSTRRIDEYGLFSSAYVLFNALYLFVQGFHLQFGGETLTVPEAMDSAGTSLLAASPFVLLAVFAPMRRAVVIGLVMIAVMAVPMLFYHSNGFSQYNVQRYALDWLPILFVILAFALTDRLRPALQVLVTYAIGLNVVTMVMLALTTGG
ncbi:glycosyltransferase family 39 protein [Microbaculum marinisediminis]|uniref:Glycosyltransferase family 39 protein n=1 Tax=Microbaculum marinisediminis TaxID=2931392 RepID=A0AAW5R0E9_9HYPH|nr:glycosyltransferase family 39 protein [Microbaculum sp. A6E488]MCT8972079.1 glycosyltransferase family 39 protein [Microbaculum sp. A6E488]